MSVFLTSPGLLLRSSRPWRDRRTWALLLAAVLVLIPTLLYYGGGWLQFGYRYFLDSIPFVWALAVMGIARKRPHPVVGLAADPVGRGDGRLRGVVDLPPVTRRP